KHRTDFARDVPPVFADRIVAATFPGMSGGFGNEDPAAVNRHIRRWGPPVIGATNAAVERHERLHQGDEPAVALLLLSQGGSAVIGVPAVERLRELCPMVKVYGMSPWPVDDLL